LDMTLSSFRNSFVLCLDSEESTLMATFSPLFSFPCTVYVRTKADKNIAVMEVALV